jgi:hypothetical protein
MAWLQFAAVPKVPNCPGGHMSQVIVPTIGRQVWFWPSTAFMERPTQPMAATVCFVHNERMVNLQVIDPNGNARPALSVYLRQPDEEAPSGGYCEWMPFQVGQAKAQAQPAT